MKSGEHTNSFTESLLALACFFSPFLFLISLSLIVLQSNTHVSLIYCYCYSVEVKAGIEEKLACTLVMRAFPPVSVTLIVKIYRYAGKNEIISF